MIVLSSGMPKSGSGYYFNLTNDLLSSAGHKDIRQLKEKHRLESLLKYYNCNIGEIEFVKFVPLLRLHLIGNSFVVKTHAPPTQFLKLLVWLNVVKVTYIYRDPRDALVSSVEARDKIFSQYRNVENSIPMVRNWLKIWEEWIGFKKVLTVRYEDLVSNPFKELKNLVNHLCIDSKRFNLDKLISKYKKDNLLTHKLPGLHFNKGIAGRFREVMTKEEQELCNRYFGDYIEKMGYQ